MAEAFVNVTEGSGKKLHAFDRTIGANTVLDEVVQQGIPYYATYSVPFSSTLLTTGASHVLQVMAGGTLNVYVHSIMMWQMVAATTAAFGEIRIVRLTTAGTGGGAATVTPYDPSDAAAGATGMTLPTAKGTEGAILDIQSHYFTQTPGAAGASFAPVYQWPPPGVNMDLVKPIKIAAGTNNGIAIKNFTALPAAACTGCIVISEANF